MGSKEVSVPETISVVPVAQQTVDWQTLNANVGPAPLVPSRSLSRLGMDHSDPLALPVALLSIHNRERELNDPFKCSDVLNHSHLAFIVIAPGSGVDYSSFTVKQNVVFKDETHTYYLMSGTLFDWYLTTIIGTGSTVPYLVRLTANIIHAFMLRTGLRKLYGDCIRTQLSDGTYTIERS